MKKNRTILGLLLVILIAGNGCHSERHSRRDIKDSSEIMVMDHSFRHHREMQGMRGSMDQGMRNGMMRNMGPGMERMGRFGHGMGMMRGMGRMSIDSIGRMPAGPGRRMLESIPNVSVSQKKMLEDLIKKQQDEMKKFREEMFAKMQDLRAAHRKDVLNILTEEQKKFLESESDNRFQSTERVK
jgi:hypothetical protein